ncbi:hypothetical protein ERO13_D09G105400v2 [Gossypium hirsutum]|uniref:Uncharacterized protein isoform X2 n=5 Tax=Gossypium TaxID=3633 RepID=A0A1U8I0J7_GOSHI|nr:uncharacterized protein LOC107891463 isoform X2 [Gossypium hirsutum]KAB2012867.1 hypothetical protein ES319_D09G119300v1 [Gossypium barbadense]TYG53742.1 hypothetical protein ES288_D09G133100v1 [Gossypium darwinii]TYH53862.1 hypothetical protein ES332_D09G129500v1 [Gossypium tomentosum]TYI64962.1 hypothetical protein E1A91_D09G124400v1 [Gossypium mustelinum]KAG4129847.1 hypothetical protein ERO13_D09G105400v2 [Gossypium hirsutum]
MDEQEFRRLLDLFPVVRSGDYHAESASSRQAASCSASNEAIKDWQDAWHDERKETENQGTDLHDKFWQKLKLTAEKKVGAAEADKLCKAFQHVHRKLVYEGLSFEAAQKFLHS